MFDEPLLALHCYITAKLGEMKNSLLKSFDVNFGHS